MKTKKCGCKHASKKHKKATDNNPLTPKYIISLFDLVRMSSDDEWKHNKKRLKKIIKRFGKEQKK